MKFCKRLVVLNRRTSLYTIYNFHSWNQQCR